MPMIYTTTDFFNEVGICNLDRVIEIHSVQTELSNNKDDRGATPLLLTTCYRHLSIARFLLEKGAEIDAKDGSGNTALLGVCFNGHTELVKY